MYAALSEESLRRFDTGLQLRRRDELGAVSNPPSPEAQMTVEFTHSGYRITIEQRGAAEFGHIT